ncbi:MAG: hypothetical protein IPQ09_23220 [Myxococcales bacterium]|nr:hypothetical protein [Myxococcales bacterium]
MHGVGVRALAMLPRFGAVGGSFLVDALEIRKVDDRVTPPRACSQDDVDTSCGPEGDCLYGRCVPASITWGPLPTPQMRRELVRTWIHLATHVLGDRAGASRGAAFAVEATRLATEARSSRELQGGLARLVNGLRNKHNSFGGVPLPSTPFDPRLGSSVDHGLGCFGVVERDLLGGGYGYGVFRAAPDGPLRVGDVVASIDGQEPKVWVDRHYPSFAPTVPGDPRADWGASATSLAELLVTRARTVTLTRCAPGTPCEGADRATVTVAVADEAFRALLGGASAATSFACTPRLRDAVASPRGRVGAEDAVDAELRPDGEVSVQFDGFSGGAAWDAAVRGVFNARPERVLMDARVGRGGQYGALKTLLSLVRGPAEPLGFFSVLRAGHDAADSARLLDLARPCAEGVGDDRACYGLGVDSMFQATGNAEPPGGASKIAWLNTNDVSANDFAARLVKGRSRARVFAPHPTSGSFGLVVSIPPLPGITGKGAIQVQDTRFSASPSGVAAAPWESGRGVEPDEVVAQRLSDLLAGEDTLLRVARAWLEAP